MKNRSLTVWPIALIAAFAPLLSQAGAVGQTSQPAYKNPSLPVEKRVDDLVSRMTLEEKVSQMMNAAAAIERLGIPEYDWWNEALHGVARAGYATVFPQAIGLAATWDDDLIYRVADVISTEARAKYNESQRKGERGRYKGLTFWSPNINIFRDPRWGRGQETYGEDPYLTSRMGVAFVKGLQGNDPRYLKVASTPKHYAVHSGPEPERHGFDAKAYERDLKDTYLPAFHATVVEGKAASIMCAYNRTNSEPCCANKTLLTEILRKQWGFSGYIVSDCGAIRDIQAGHHFAGSEPEASAMAVKAGTDLSCGREYESLVKAVKDGLITEAEIDTALKRLMTARFRLGMFDPPEMVPYSRIPLSENDSAAHRELSLKTARESIVLLKNDNGALPLRKTLKTFAVIGPNADAPEVLLGNYFGQPSKSVTPLQGIRNKLGSATTVLYALGATVGGESTAPVPSAALMLSGKGSAPGVKGEYFDNKELKGEPVLTRTDERIEFDWGRGRPMPQLGDTNFSVRWSCKLTPPESGAYKLGAKAEGGVRLYLDGQLLVDAWASNPDGLVVKDVELDASRSYDVRMEYYKNTRGAVAKLVWSYPRFAEKLIEEACNAARQSDEVVMVLGISPTLEGEEMRVNVEGFRGGDRIDLGLPKSQEDLLKAVVELKKPTVVVLLNGSALAVNYADQTVPGIVEAWYPGEEGGTAIADVLFGDYNPAGRLPVTFYRSAGQLPPFEDYDMEGHTYRYFKGDPLYPFGFGLSYTRFSYSNLRFSSDKIKAGGSVRVSADVQNTGALAGDEVGQLYVTVGSTSVSVPIRSLAAFKRISLRPSQKETISFTLRPEQMSIIQDNGKRVVDPVEILITVGGKQPGFVGHADANTTGAVKGSFKVVGGPIEIPE